MIDIHSHILHGIDDGSYDMATSVKMAEMAVSEGITQMIATPHFIEKDQEIDRKTILEKTEELNGELRSRGINITIHPGQEVYITPGIPDLFNEGKLMTLCDEGLYMLVELPMMSIPPYALEVIHRLKLRGVNVILAHPERNVEIMKNPERVKEFMRIGTLLQVNSLSLIGVFGNETKRTAGEIISSGWAHFIATDCHTARVRSPRIRGVLKDIPDKAFRHLLHDNPAKVLKGEQIDPVTMSYERRGIGFQEKLSAFIHGLIGIGQ